MQQLMTLHLRRGGRVQAGNPARGHNLGGVMSEADSETELLGTYSSGIKRKKLFSGDEIKKLQAEIARLEAENAELRKMKEPTCKP